MRDDWQSFRRAVKYSCALAGGRFNPIIFADLPDEATRIINVFRVDVLITLGDDAALEEFKNTFPHLINPFYADSLFSNGTEHSPPSCSVFDVHNQWRAEREVSRLGMTEDTAISIYRWSSSDPLSDALLVQLGSFPDSEEIGTDYERILKDYFETNEVTIKISDKLPESIVDGPTLSYLAKRGLEVHHSVRAGHRFPGFFVGNSSYLIDLVCFWNLRACNVALAFIDSNHLDRFANVIPKYNNVFGEMVSHFRHHIVRKICIWSTEEAQDVADSLIPDAEYIQYQISPESWNGLNLRAPMMYFCQESALGVVIDQEKSPRVSFSMANKPTSDYIWFSHQCLVASISVVGSLYNDPKHTFYAPYLPELNEFYGRTMNYRYNRFRAEPERLAIVIDSSDHDAHLDALSVIDLAKAIFDLVGYEARLSNAGLINQQLIDRMGGTQGPRVFKLPGVRRLLKTHGPNASMTKKAALQIIGSGDPERPEATFDKYNGIYIESRPWGTDLTPNDVFGYLVEKGLFRVGLDLSCPSCQLTSWIPIEILNTEATCELCGNKYNSTRQLVDTNQLSYRRSGVFGMEKNAQGAVPVSLTIQQLDSNIRDILDGGSYTPSLDLIKKEGKAKCETDLL